SFPLTSSHARATSFPIRRSSDLTAAKFTEKRFEVTTLDNETYSAKKLLLATGVVDNVPDVPGLRELYGKSVFHCPYCDGYELRGDRKSTRLKSSHVKISYAVFCL